MPRWTPHGIVEDGPMDFPSNESLVEQRDRYLRGLREADRASRREATLTPSQRRWREIAVTRVEREGENAFRDEPGCFYRR